jgi:hypothetical protein
MRAGQGTWIVLTAIASSASFSAACGLNKFDDTLTDQATIPGKVTMGAPFSLMYGGAFSSGLDLSTEKSFQNNGVKPSQVDAIYVKAVHIEAMPDVEHFDVILQSLTISVEAPNVPMQTIAMGSDFPSSNEADLTVMSMVNLKPYAVSPMMQVGTNAVLKQQPGLNTTIKTTVTIEVDIHLPGT